jgi:hypothetical protein
MTTTKYATPEQLTKCWTMAKRNSNAYIDNDDARAYVATHYGLRKTIVQAQVQMYKARYEFELSNLLGEDGCDDSPHFDKSFTHCMRAAKLRDEAKGMLQVADDIDRETCEWLVYTYLYDLATI